MEKAVIEGLETKESKGKEEDKHTLDEIIENTKQSYMIDLVLSQEAAKMALGEYSDEYIYNIPRASDSGKEDWGSLCDKMPNGYCYYRANKIKHVHVIGVNINGAIAIMNAYMGLTIKPSDPEIKEFTILQDGKIITKSYWHTTVHISNKKTETELDLPFLQDVMQKSGKGYIYNEYGSQICISKGMRNAILKVVPENFQRKWIEEYKSNGKEIPKAGTSKAGKTEAQSGSNKGENKGNEEMTADSAIEHINSIEAIEHLSNWYNKNSAWVNKQAPADKKRIVEAFNSKRDQLNKPTETANPATTEQYETIRQIAQQLGYDPDQLDALCKSLTGFDDIGDMDMSQAETVLNQLKSKMDKKEEPE